jgi:TBC1 domain family protein 5
VKRLFRAESEPTHSAKSPNGKSEVKISSVARNLLEDFNRQLVSEPVEANPIDVVNNEDSSIRETEDINTDFETAAEESIVMEENSSDLFSDPNSPLRDSNYIENDSDSSNESNLFPDETVKDRETSVVDSPLSISSQPSMEFIVSLSKDQETSVVDSPLPVSSQPSIEFPVTQSNDEDNAADKSVANIKERSKVLPGKFQWFWKFGRNVTAEETRCNGVESSKSDLVCSSESHSLPQASSSGSKGDTDQNVMNTLKNLGNSMLEHIQVIESVFQQERGQVQAGLIENLSKNNLVEKGQVTAMTALKELRKISNLLLEM